jgi:fructose transport system permease protein
MAEDAKAVSGSYEAGLKGATEKVAEFHEDRTALKRVQHWLHQTPSAVPLIVLVVALAVFGVLSENFFKAGTLTTILQQIAIVGILGCAQTIVILTAGIDLSVGAIAVFSSVLMGQMTFRYGIPAPAAIAIGLLPPFIVTLGTLSIFNALKLWYSQSESIRNVDIEAKAKGLLWFGQGFNFGGASISYGGIMLIVLAGILWYILNNTAWGRHVHAIGDDPDAAMLSGINVGRTLISVYAVAGLICGFAGLDRDGARRLHLSDRVRHGQPRVDHRRGDRRHIAVRRAWVYHRVRPRCLHRRRVQHRPALAGVDDYWQMFAA